MASVSASRICRTADEPATIGVWVLASIKSRFLMNLFWLFARLCQTLGFTFRNLTPSQLYWEQDTKTADLWSSGKGYSLYWIFQCQSSQLCIDLKSNFRVPFTIIVFDPVIITLISIFNYTGPIVGFDASACTKTIVPPLQSHQNSHCVTLPLFLIIRRVGRAAFLLCTGAVIMELADDLFIKVPVSIASITVPPA